MAGMYDAAPHDGGLPELFDSSPDVPVHTSAAAETGFLLGLAALLAAPFAVMHGLVLGVGAVAAFLALVGLGATSRPNVSGRALAPFGLLFALAALVLVGLRYLGVDTTFGDPFVPTIGGWLEDLNSLFPRP